MFVEKKNKKRSQNVNLEPTIVLDCNVNKNKKKSCPPYLLIGM